LNSATSSIDFFISYSDADVAWAEWIAWTLERDGGYAVCLPLWDFVPGTNFPLKTQEAVARAKHTIAVLSPAYLRGNFTGSHWAAAFARDPSGIDRQLIPVMVEACAPDGLLGPIVSVRLTGLDETTAREKLLQGVSRGLRPTRFPAFPGASQAAPEHPAASPGVPPAFPAAPRSPGVPGTAPTDTAPAPEPPAPVPWMPLATDPPVSWENAGPWGVSASAGHRLELHLLPVVPDIVQDLRRIPLTVLVSAGREAGLFPASATVTTETSKNHIAAFLADTAGLRVTKGGQRSGWLRLPLTEESVPPTAVADAITRLVAATANLRPGLQGRVAFGVAISSGDKTTQRHPPRSWLSSRYLAGHVPQVAAELAEQFIGDATGLRPFTSQG
jgi:hypothetical protein